MRTLATLLAGLLLAVPASAAKFTSATLAGTYSGTWTNKTFGSTGTITATITAVDANTIQISHDVGGNVFGCQDPQAAVLTLVNGTDWSAKGLRFTRTDFIYGTMTAKLTKGGVLKAGAPASCGGNGPKWTLTGKLKKNVLKGTFDIRFKDGQVMKAKAVMTVNRTP